VFVPRSLGPPLRLFQAVPPRARRALVRVIGLDELYAAVDPAARREYEERAAGG
jgi:hypothetical protein